MNQKHWKFSGMTALVVAAFATLSIAQGMPDAARNAHPARGANGFISTLQQKVGLTPEQRDAVRGLLAEQRQKSQSLREETDGKIRALLNPEQQKKFDEVLVQQKARFAKPKAS